MRCAVLSLLMLMMFAGRSMSQDAEANPIPVKRPNLLVAEKSPYLLQHADNPVQWMPWGAAAFERARLEDKPIFLSVGYSTCHWCHVMARESFEDEALASYLNKHFVCVKVDREERPDVDRLYMNFLQSTTGSGGWPMNIWMTPELKPFFGGTYFPPEDRPGRPSFRTVLKRVIDGWSGDRKRVVQFAAESLADLRRNANTFATASLPSASVLNNAFQTFAKQFDEEHGGLGRAPKFPRPSVLRFLLGHAKRLGPDSTDGKLAAAMVRLTLQKMIAGGIHDHIGGGFHRYSVDRFWHVPHYEKMLYDQAQLAALCLETFQLTGDAEALAAARSTLNYVLRDMRDPAGGFHSAEDADSAFELHKPEHGEGAFYTWTKAEIDQLLGEDAPLFCAVYGVMDDGNSPKGSDPLGELKGRNTLARKFSNVEAAHNLLSDDAPETVSAVEEKLFECRALLLEARTKRPRPHRDDKVLSGWNGLMISALAKGAAVLENPEYLKAAEDAARFLKAQLWSEGVLLRAFRRGAGTVPAFAEDYAFMIQGLLDLYSANSDTGWLEWAIELQTTMDHQLWDDKTGGYFSSAQGDEGVIVRLKEEHDGAEPSAGSVAVCNLLRLSELTGLKGYKARAERTVRAFGGVFANLPTSLPLMLHGLGLMQNDWIQIVIAGDPSSTETAALLAEANKQYLPNSVVIFADGAGANRSVFGDRSELFANMRPTGGKPTAYVCLNATCLPPVTDPTELKNLLKGR